MNLRRFKPNLTFGFFRAWFGPQTIFRFWANIFWFEHELVDRFTSLQRRKSFYGQH